MEGNPSSEKKADPGNRASGFDFSSYEGSPALGKAVDAVSSLCLSFVNEEAEADTSQGWHLLGQSVRLCSLVHSRSFPWRGVDRTPQALDHCKEAGCWRLEGIP